MNIRVTGPSISHRQIDSLMPFFVGMRFFVQGEVTRAVADCKESLVAQK